MLSYDPVERATCTELLGLDFFRGFEAAFMEDLQESLAKDAAEFQMKPKKNRRRQRSNDTAQQSSSSTTHHSQNHHGGGGGGGGGGTQHPPHTHKPTSELHDAANHFNDGSLQAGTVGGKERDQEDRKARRTLTKLEDLQTSGAKDRLEKKEKKHLSNLNRHLNRPVLLRTC